MKEAARDTRQTTKGWNIRHDAERAEQARTDGWWGEETLATRLDALASSAPQQLLVSDDVAGLSAVCLRDQARQLANVLAARLAPGSVVSFMLPNWHEAAIIYAAASYAGMVAHPILPSLRDHDLVFMLADADVKMIFIPGQFRGHDYAAMLDRVADQLVSPPQIVIVRSESADHMALAALIAQGSDAPLPPVAADDVRMLMYTSGTTGRPKGVLHTHNTINALIRQIGAHWLIEPGDRFLVPSPISHIGGSIYAFECPILLGTRAILMERWDAEAAIALMLREKITHMAGATPFLRQLLDAARAQGTRLPDLKLFICGGASVPPALVREASDWFGRAIVSRVYGSTEVPVTTVGCLAAAEAEAAAETDGRPGIATVRIAPDGEIRARGPQMFAGYLHADDEATAFDAAGFYRTGDQGRMTDGGELVVTGRIKDLIIRNGENIAPKEVEDLLLTHPDVAEIAIVGIPDPKTGERAVALVVPRATAQPEVADFADFLSALGVARFKYPESVILCDNLPKNDAGKVLKHAIRATLVAQKETKDDR